MFKEVILKNKIEMEELLSKEYVCREQLKKNSRLIENKLIKVIVGPRRAGKSILSLLLLKDKEFAYLNFDDEQLLKVNSYDELLTILLDVYNNTKYLFFDEIQNLKNWELFINKLHRRGYNIVITGSNSKLLSTDLASALTGRHTKIELLPFSFKEYLQAKRYVYDKEKISTPKNKAKLLNLLKKYVVEGGFPNIILDNIDYKIYLDTLFDSILFKDIVKRHDIKNAKWISDLAVYLISTSTKEYTYNSLKNNLGFNSTATVQNYLNYLEEAYLFFTLNRFCYKLKEQIKYPRKIYSVDNGFITTKSFTNLSDLSKLIENLVFLDLLRKNNRLNLDLFYYKTKNNKEVDFLIREGTKVKQLIQVTYDLSDKKTRQREINSLIEASKELNCKNLVVITYDEEKIETHNKNKITFVPLWKWLLEDK